MTQETKITLVGCGIASVLVAGLSVRINYMNKWKNDEIERLTAEDGELFHLSFTGSETKQAAAQETLEMLFKRLVEATTKKSFHRWLEIIKSFKEEMASCASSEVVIAKYKALYTPDKKPEVVYTIPLV